MYICAFITTLTVMKRLVSILWVSVALLSCNRYEFDFEGTVSEAVFSS
jgi:hypothetical protein